MLGVAAVAVVRALDAAAGRPPPTALSVGLDLAVVGALAAAYVALTAQGRTGSSPLRALWTALLVGLGALVAEAIVGTLHDGTIDPKTALPADVETAALAAVVGAADALLALTVLVCLRPLVLYRRRRAAIVLWGALLACGVGAALTVAGRPLTSYSPPAMIPFLVGVVLVGVGLAVRQGWVAALSFRERLGAAALALVLSATLIGLIYVREEGPTLLVVGDGSGEVEAVAYTAALSRPLAAAALVATAFGGLYAFAAGLVLLLGLPAADARDQRVGERRALRSLTDLSGGVLDRAAVAAAVARGPVEAGLGDAAWLALADPKRGALAPVVVAAEGIALDTSAAAVDAGALAQAAADGGGPLVLGHAEADHRVRVRPGGGVGSLAVFPISGGGPSDGLGGLRGALFVARAQADAFEPDDVSALETFAGQAALSLSHADLFSEALERERLARELSLARDVQRRLLPQSIPEVDGVEVAAAEIPAREVGGDYYDVVRLGDDCLGLLVADVSGKGAAAAFYMAEMKGVFQVGSRLTRAPGELLARANEALAPSFGRGVFASAVYAVLDAEAETLTIARAGHTPAVLVRDGTRTDGGRWLLRSDGLAIGLDREGALFRRTLREQAVTLAPGDTLVLYTDGLVEARDAAGEEYGYDRLAAFAERHAACGATELRDRLLDERRRWSGHDEPDDDTTLVVVRWTGRGTSPPPADVSAGPPLTERPAFAREHGAVT